MKHAPALLALSLGVFALAAQADEPRRHPGFEPLRFAPADYSPYRDRQVERAVHPGVDWSGLAPPRPEPRIAVPAVIRGAAAGGSRRP